MDKLIKKYFATINVRNGEYETLTHYLFSATNHREALKTVKNDWDIDVQFEEQYTELESLFEVSEDEYKVLSRFI